jgi:thiaminase/transcriptional activator TenA
MPRRSDALRAAAGDLWEAQHAHPFVRGIGDGTLDRERFRHFVRQDYLFLVDYARVLAYGAARAPRLDWQRRFAALTQAVLDDELELHRAYAAEWEISAAELETEEPTPTTRAYTDFLLRTAALGDFAELVAAVLPCMWGYSELGQRLGQLPRPADSRYAGWIETYASEDFAELAAWCRTLADSVATTENADAMREAFVTCSRHELAFWDACWRLEA